MTKMVSTLSGEDHSLQRGICFANFTPRCKPLRRQAGSVLPVNLALSAPMIFDLAKIVLIGAPIIFVASVAYVNLLLRFSRIRSAIVKFTATMVIYIPYALLIVSPMFLLIGAIRPFFVLSWWYKGAPIILYVVTVGPGLHYFQKSRRKLREAGYRQV